MKQIQKRYIYSAVVSSLFFIVSYGILNLNILLALLFTILIYVGGVFFFKEKDIRPFDSENVNNYYFLASKLSNKAENQDNVKIREIVSEITGLTDKILLSLEQRPKKVEQVFDFFDYYLDMSYKILYRYENLRAKSELTKDEKDFITNIELYLSRIKDAFDKQYKNMQEAKMLDISSEIQVFEKTLGIKKSDLKVGEENETK